MQTFGKLLIVAAAVSLRMAASAQTATGSDIAYCTALSDTYVLYIGHDEDNSSRLRYLRGSLDGHVTVAKCKQGDASAIPVLEKKLTDAKFTLPARG